MLPDESYPACYNKFLPGTERFLREAHEEMLGEGNFNQNYIFFPFKVLNSFTILASLSVIEKKLISVIVVSELNQLRDLEY